MSRAVVASIFNIQIYENGIWTRYKVITCLICNSWYILATTIHTLRNELLSFIFFFFSSTEKRGVQFLLPMANPDNAKLFFFFSWSLLFQFSHCLNSCESTPNAWPGVIVAHYCYPFELSHSGLCFFFFLSYHLKNLKKFSDLVDCPFRERKAIQEFCKRSELLKVSNPVCVIQDSQAYLRVYYGRLLAASFVE